MFRLVLADDHAVLRSGLRMLLSNFADVEIVGEAATGLEAIELAKKLQPDLLILDLSMPQLNGLDALPTLREVAPQTRVLVLTMHENPEYVREALQRGVAGYLLKKAADSELRAAIEAILRGEVYIHSSLTRILLEDMLPGSSKTATEDAWDTLSQREQDVLKMVALGYTSSEIAEQLNISAKTVDTYRARGMEKLGIQTRAALVRYALKKGLIDWPERPFSAPRRGRGREKAARKAAHLEPPVVPFFGA
jgi:two-component system response regulator NreC